MTSQLRIVAHSEIGLVRKNNQDSGYASSHLLVVADGMGGAAAGDLASAVAVDTIRALDEPTDSGRLPVEGDKMLEMLAGALHKANDRIAELVEDDYALEGMGTTVTGAMFDGRQFGLAHIGDSRAYLLHDSRLERLTHDHSWVQSLVDNGKLSEGEAAVHPHRSLLLKVLNGQPANNPDLTLVKVEVGDRLLICSDGLCGLVDDPDIEAAVQVPDLETALRRLVDGALAQGGIDNITVILADVVDSADPASPVALGAAVERSIPTIGSRPHSARPASGPSAPTEDPTPLDTVDEAPTTAAPAASAGAATQNSEDDEARYSPQPPRARPVARSLLAVVAAVLVLGAVLGSAYAWTRTQFFVGASGESVAIFQGLSQSLPGVPLSRLYEVQPLAVGSLPPYYQERVRGGIDVSDLSAARQTVAELTETAKRCAGAVPRSAPSSTPSAPASTPAPRPPGSPAQSAAASPVPPATSSAAGTPVAPASPASATPEPEC